MSQTKKTKGVVIEPEFLASWALTTEPRLSWLTRIAHHGALNGRRGHRLVCEEILSQRRRPMRSERALRASSVVLLRR